MHMCPQKTFIDPTRPPSLLNKSRKTPRFHKCLCTPTKLQNLWSIGRTLAVLLSHRVEHMVVWSRAEHEDELEVGLLVMPAPIEVSLGIRSRVRSRGCTVDHIP
jgi:hypothetical protein